MIVYRIVSTISGLYSTGGSDPCWAKTGKLWKGKGPLNLHMNQLSPQGRRIYMNHEAYVVQYEIEETMQGSEPVTAWIQAVDKRQQKRDTAAQAANKARKLAEERLQYEALHAKFGPKDK